MKKRLISLLLTVAMLLTLVVVPTNAALVAGTGTLTITPNVTSVPGSASAPIEVIYTIKVTPPAGGPVGEFHFNLKAPDGMTLSEVKLKPQAGNKGGDGYWVNMNDLWYNPTTEEGVFETFEYTPASKYFQAFGTSASRNMTEEADIMTIKATIAAGKVGDFTLTAENVGINKDGTDSYSVDVKTTPVTVVSSISGDLTVTIAKPVVNQEPVTTLNDTQYSGTITWDPAVTSGGKFAASTVYTANVTLTAKDGYQFASDVNPTVAGATISSVSADGTKLTFKAKFDATGSLPAATVTDAPTAKTGLTYKGTDQELVNAGTATGGTMQYSLNNNTWSDAIPKGKDAKTYTVYYKVKGNSDHTDFIPTSNTVSVTIGPKSIADSTVKIAPIPNQVYDGGNELKPLPVVKDGATTLKKGTDYTVSYTNNTNAGTATLTITGKGNYEGTKAANFTIDPAKQVLTVPGSANVAFNKILNLNTICSSNAHGATLTFARPSTSSLPAGTTFDATTGIVTAGNKTGSFEVTVDSAAVPNYKAALQGRITVYIVATPAASVTAAPTAKTDLKYNGNDQALVSAGTANGGTMQYSSDNSTWSNEIPKGKNAGNYTVYYKVKGDSDHTDFTPTSNTVSVSIAQKEVTVAPGTYKVSKEYDTNTTAGTGNGTLSVTGIVDSGVSVKATPVAYTSANVGGQSNVDVNLALSGTGSANYKLAASKISVPCSITPAKLTVTGATVAAKTYDGSTDATVSAVTFSGTKGSDALTVGTDYTVSGVFNSANVKEANKVIVTVTLKDTTLTKNYKLASSTYNQAATISQAPTPAAPTGLTGIKGNLLNTVALPTGWTWINGTQKMEEAGVDKPFGAHYEDPNGNYAPNISGTPVLVTVLAKNDVNTKITFPNGSLVYNGNGQKYEKASISGITASGTAEWTYTYAVDPSTATATLDSGLPLTVGKYTVTATYEDSANYGTATATLEITPAKPTVTPKFDKITEKGKTLANANLTIASSSPVGGKIEWVDDAGAVLPGTTAVEANKAYKWRYTPLDTTNYAPVYGTIVVYPTSTGIVVYCPHYTIKASAGANGTISPAGWCSVAENGSQTFTFTPDKGYSVAKVLVDGKSVGAVKSYTFKDVTKDHTIEVIFMKSNGNPATGAFVMP